MKTVHILRGILFPFERSERPFFLRSQRRFSCPLHPPVLERLGWQVDPASEELRVVRLPAQFDALLEDYNALQLAQGWDLGAAAGKSCLCCSYDLVGFPDWDGRVIATLYLYRGRVIGGDLHTAAVGGFMRPLRPTAREKL